ncbi:DUF2914 domain-containing protein [Paraliomyxa miuraensis]|nr:DUF2914 domain-containing protein [Paraliomyxa miuraensis]
MPLSLPNPRRDRPRRPIEPLAPPLREPPQRTYSFDPNAARQAWRQVARTRGAYAMRLDGRDPGGKLAPLTLALVALAVFILWATSREDVEPVQAPAVTTNDVDPASPMGTEPRSLQPEPEAVEPALRAGASSFSDTAEEDEPPPEPAVQRSVPPGTDEDNAKALLKLPHAASDRPPLGGIGPMGMHVDRIAMGTEYEDGSCMGPTGKFSARDDDFANLCFRVVHPRTRQKVIVRWERGGKLVRRTFVTIDDSHAYRTRAVLPLRRRYRGEWTARVVSAEDGVELASQTFQVL